MYYTYLYCMRLTRGNYLSSKLILSLMTVYGGYAMDRMMGVCVRVCGCIIIQYNYMNLHSMYIHK